MSTSKTARASMNAGAQMQAKADPFDTNEKKIKELRNQRKNKLFVIRQDFIDALIEEYDAALAKGAAVGVAWAAFKYDAALAKGAAVGVGQQVFPSE